MRQPKRNSNNPCCGRRGRCSCYRRANAMIAANPEAAPQPCPQIHGNGQACGKTMRGGKCPCPDC